MRQEFEEEVIFTVDKNNTVKVETKSKSFTSGRNFRREVFKYTQYH